MKKLLVIAVLGLSAISGWSQGQVDFRNGATLTFATVADRTVKDALGAPLVGTTWKAGLWYNVGNNTDLNGPTKGRQAGQAFSFRPATTSFKGIWVVPVGSSSLLTLDGVAATGAEAVRTATLQVRVWDQAKFADFAAAFGGGEFGASAPFTYIAPDTAGTVTPDKYYMENLRGFSVVPEPSTIALGVLGAASLLFLRRRK